MRNKVARIVRQRSLVQLGAVASAMSATLFPDSDYEVESECNALIASAQDRALDAVAQRFGFANREHLRSHIAERTSPRWAYFNLPW